MTSPKESTDALLEERIQEVRQQWLARAGDVRTGTITYDDVADILLMLAEHGVPPTVRAVREIYGSGSPNVINPLIRAAWMRRDLPQRMATRAEGSTVPPRLIQFWDLLVSDATGEAKRQLASQQQNLIEQTEALLQKEKIIDERVTGMQTQIALQEDSLKDLRASLAATAKERDRLVETLAEERNTVSRLQAENTNLMQQKDQAAAQLKAAADELITSRKNEAKLKIEIDQAKKATENALKELATAKRKRS